MNCDGKCTLDYCKHAMQRAEQGGHDRAAARISALEAALGVAADRCDAFFQKWNPRTANPLLGFVCDLEADLRRALSQPALAQAILALDASEVKRDE